MQKRARGRVVRCVDSNVTGTSVSQYTSVIPQVADLYLQPRIFYILTSHQLKSKQYENV